MSNINFYTLLYKYETITQLWSDKFKLVNFLKKLRNML